MISRETVPWGPWGQAMPGGLELCNMVTVSDPPNVESSFYIDIFHGTRTVTQNDCHPLQRVSFTAGTEIQTEVLPHLLRTQAK